MPLLCDNPNGDSSVVNRMGFTVENAKRLSSEERKYLLEQIDSNKWSDLILSSEILFRIMSMNEVDQARRFFTSLSDDIRVLAYIRSPVQYYMSVTQQLLKTASIIRPPSGSSISKVLGSYQTIFGQPVQTRVFEKSNLLDGDVVKDFLDWSGLPIPPNTVTTKRSNESVSAECIAVLYETMPPNRPKSAEQLSLVRKLRRSIIMADRSIEAPTKPSLNSDVVANLTAQCTELSVLRDNFGLEFSDIDYDLVRNNPPSPLEITQISQLCSYDLSRKELVSKTAKKNLEHLFKREEKKHRKQNSRFKRIRSFIGRSIRS